MTPHSSSRRLDRWSRNRLVLLALGLGACAPLGEPGPRRANVVLIVVDTLRADATDASWTNTPSLGALAREGLRFSKAFSHAPSTLPSHTALFSSRLPSDTGVLNNGDVVPAGLPLLAEHLGQHGYATQAVVSLGTLNPKGSAGLARGFDHYDLDYWHMDKAPRALGRMRAGLEALDPGRPFFLFAHFSDPHAPYSSHGREVALAQISIDGEPRHRAALHVTDPRERDLSLSVGEHRFELRAEEEFRIAALELRQDGLKLALDWEAEPADGFARQRAFRVSLPRAGEVRFRYWLSQRVRSDQVREHYQSEVEYVDRQVGALLGELKARGLYDNSLILLTSDHGEALGDVDYIGHIQNLSDELLHVPLILKLPKGHPAFAALSQQRDRLVPHWNLVPTILELIDLPALPGQRGVSLLGDEESLLIAETHRPEARRNYIGIRNETHKLVFAPDRGVFYLFDLLADPGEANPSSVVPSAKHQAWEALLRGAAERAALAASGAHELTPEEQVDLDALGYASHAEED